MNIILKLTDRCNNDCQYCYDKTNRNRFGDIDRTVLDHLIQLINMEDKVNLVFHGGEPLLYGYEAFNDLVHTLKNLNTEVTMSVQTNGLLLDDKWAYLFLADNISCSTSVDFKKGRKLELTLDKLKHYADMGLNLGVISVITNENICHMIDMYIDLIKSGVNSVAFNTVYDTDNPLDVDLHYKEFSKFYKFLNSRACARERNYLTYMCRYLGMESNLQCSPDNCRYNWLTITPNGNLYPCDRPSMLNYGLGNLLDYRSLNDIINTDKYLNYVNSTVKLQTEHCLNCEINTFCRTGCLCNHNLLDSKINTYECAYASNYYRIIENLIKGE